MAKREEWVTVSIAPIWYKCVAEKKDSQAAMITESVANPYVALSRICFIEVPTWFVRPAYIC